MFYISTWEYKKKVCYYIFLFPQNIWLSTIAQKFFRNSDETGSVVTFYAFSYNSAHDTTSATQPMDLFVFLRHFCFLKLLNQAQYYISFWGSIWVQHTWKENLNTQMNSSFQEYNNYDNT